MRDFRDPAVCVAPGSSAFWLYSPTSKLRHHDWAARRKAEVAVGRRGGLGRRVGEVSRGTGCATLGRGGISWEVENVSLR